MDIRPPGPRPTSGTRARIDPGGPSSSSGAPPAASPAGRRGAAARPGGKAPANAPAFTDPSLADPSLQPPARRPKGFYQAPPEPTGLHHGVGGGRNASLYYARRKIERDQERDRLYNRDHTPKAIESALKRQREQPYRRTLANSLPSPMKHVGNFLADPQKRFWLGCNVCCVVMLLGVSVLFLLFLYPMLLRPIVRY